MELAEQIAQQTRRTDRLEDAMTALMEQQQKFFADMDKRQEKQDRRNEEQDKRHEQMHIKHLELYADNKAKHIEIQWIKKVFWIVIVSFVGGISSLAGTAYHLNRAYDLAIHTLQINDVMQRQSLEVLKDDVNKIIKFLDKKNERPIK